MPNTMMWTLLPNGIDRATGRARLSLVAHPRVQSPTGTLAGTPLADWPAVLGDLGDLFIEVAGAGLLVPQRHGEPPSRSLWRVLFPPTTRVRPAEPDPEPFSSLATGYDYAWAQEAISGIYAAALDTPTEPVGPGHPIATVLRTLGSSVDGAVERSGDATADALAAVVRHLRAGRSGPGGVPDPVVPVQPAPLDTVDPIDTADVHQVLGLLADHPALARLFGLVIDLSVPIGPALKGEVQIRIGGPIGPPLSNRDDFAQVDNPWSRVVCDPAAGTFVMATRPGPGTEVVAGMLDLRPQGTKYALSTVDVPALTAQLGALGSRLAANPEGDPALTGTSGLPARRDSGITVAQSGRAAGVVAHAVGAAARLAAPENRSADQPVLHADDVTMGYRVDVARGGGPFRSLMRRSVRYVIGSTGGRTDTVTVHDEGHVEPIVAVQQTVAPGVHTLTTGEEVFGWNGWSLAAAMPGPAVVAETLTGPAVGTVEPQAAPGYDLLVHTDVEPGSLERLRYGQTYRFRARAVDLAGNSLSAADADAPAHAGFTTGPVLYPRQEPVPPPRLVPRAAFGPGETLTRVIVRTDGDGNPLGPVGERHLVPPAASQRTAERHGMFDAAFGPDVPAAVRDRMLALGAREAGTLADPRVPAPGGTGTVPADGIAVIAPAGQPATLPLPPGVALPPGQYVVHATDRMLLPDLPDPAARGAGLIPEGADPGEVTIAGYGDGAWPNLLPARLRLHAGAAYSLTTGTAAGRSTVEVTLAPGERLVADLASALHPAAVELFAPPSQNARALGAMGQVPIYSPRQRIELLHATRRPLGPLAFTESFTLHPATSWTIAGKSTHHEATTATLEVVASWDEIIDSGTGPVRTEHREATLPLVESEFITGVLESEMVLAAPEAEQATENFTLQTATHEFGSTARRDLTLTLVATTRFRDCFPELTDGDPRGQRTAPMVPRTKFNCATPARPQVHSLIPTWTWERSTAGGAHTSTRRRNGVRVWLRRPWMTTGVGETLAVWVWADALTGTTGQNGTSATNTFVSRWGRDPVEQVSGPTVGPLLGSSFPAGTAQPKGGSGAAVIAVTHPVQFDVERDMWFADVELTAGDPKPLLLRLGLSRYQEKTSNAAKSSPVVVSDWIALGAEHRTLTVRRVGPQAFDVTVTGPAVKNRNYAASLQPRLLPKPPGASPTAPEMDITLFDEALKTPLTVVSGPDGTFTATGQLQVSGVTDPVQQARLLAGRIVVRELNVGHRLDSTIPDGRIDWLDTVELADIP